MANLWGCRPGCGTTDPYFENSGAQAALAQDSLYIVATGASVDSPCTDTGNQIRCQRFVISGFVPGLIAFSADVDSVVDDGLIVEAFWTFNTRHIDETKAVIEYEAWLEATHPDVRNRLFEPEGTTMVLDATTVPEHRRYTSEFKASGANVTG